MASGSRGAVEGVEALEADGDASSADAGRLLPCGQLGGARREKWRVHADLSRARTSRSGRAEARRRRSAAAVRGRAAAAPPSPGPSLGVRGRGLGLLAGTSASDTWRRRDAGPARSPRTRPGGDVH